MHKNFPNNSKNSGMKADSDSSEQKSSSLKRLNKVDYSKRQGRFFFKNVYLGDFPEEYILFELEFENFYFLGQISNLKN